MLARSLTETVRSIVGASLLPLAPKEIRDIIKTLHPEFYGTPAHLRNVERGHYQSLDHALLAQIYGVVRAGDDFFCDYSTKPYSVSLTTSELVNDIPELEAFEANNGYVYVLKTGTYTQHGREIIKIGFTSLGVERRIAQLYTTGVPFEFSIHKIYSARNFIELEQVLHKIFVDFRINKSREFFTDEVLPFIDAIVAINSSVQERFRTQ